MFHDERTTPLVQFKPARAKKKIASIFDLHLPGMWDEQKIDGERYLLQTNRPTARFKHGITSRRESVITGRFVEKTDRVPHIANAPIEGLNILDSEFVSSGDLRLIDLPGKFWDKLLTPEHPHMQWIKNTYQGALPVYPHVGNTVSIMGSLGPEAIQKQQTRGLIWAYCFDLIQYQNQNATNLPQSRRRELLATMLSTLPAQDGIILMPTWSGLTPSEVEEFFYLVTDVPPGETDGGEGLIRKDPTAKYNAASAWYKLKKDYPADCVLTGDYKMGKEGATGKMLGLVGSLAIGVYLNNELVHIGWMSAIMDSEAKLIALTEDAIAGNLRGRVYECRHNGLQPDSTTPCKFTLRHPRARRPREDKNATDCTWQILKAEVTRVGVV